MIERQHSEKSIFLEAIEIASLEERVAYLDASCGEDRRLREEVEALLRAYERPRRLLDSPGSLTPTVAFEASSERVGSQVGPYKLMEQIGEGGMGVVYVAEQQMPVRRKVALKIIKPGMDTRQVIARFEAERQALAMMDHPNISKVHDGGTTESGRPYFVMELVRGQPITEYCDGERLSIRERLELFVLVCRAVQHAHQKGIIHRDLKPSNILVTLHDGVPVPKIIDFGVAKATGQSLTEKTIYTAFTQLVGTPLYMSPEQVEMSGLDVDTRSDIYALGVLLYELLTGTTPFDPETLREAAFDELRRIIREQEPPKPSMRLSTLGVTLTTTSAKRSSDPRQLNRSVRGELDWIVMKSLEKDRRRRYETANDFAADVMRYLTNQPVEACPPSVRYRFAKFLRRNRAVTIPTAILTLLTVAGLSIGMAVVTRERDVARAQRQHADKRFRLAFQTVDNLTEVLFNLRSTAGPERTSRLQGSVKEDLLRYYHQLVEKNEDNPGIAYEVAESYFWLGALYSPGGIQNYRNIPPVDPERADRAHLKAVGLFERLAQEKPDDTLVLCTLANILQMGGSYQRSLDIFERVARTHLDHANDWYLICNVAWNYGGVLRNQGRLAEAEALNRRVLAWFERPEFNLNWLERKDGVRPMGKGYDGFMALSNLLVSCGEPLKAIPVLERARKYLVFDSDYEFYRFTLSNLVWKLATDADPMVRARAVQLARECVELSSRIDPHSPQSLLVTEAQSWLLLGLALNQAGDRQAADDAFRRGIELDVDKADNTLNSFAWRLVSEPPFRTVRQTWAVQIAERAAKSEPSRATVWNTLGVAHYRAGHWKAAIEALEKAETLAPEKYLALNGFFLAMAHWQKDQKGEARKWYHQAVEWMERNQPDDAELRRFRTEAEELLGIAVKQKL